LHLSPLAGKERAAQALVDRLVVLAHLLQRIHRRGIDGLFGFALGGEFGLLPLIARLALGFRLDEPALLHRRDRGRGSEKHGKHG
jgi:hypothetical protein